MIAALPEAPGAGERDFVAQIRRTMRPTTCRPDRRGFRGLEPDLWGFCEAEPGPGCASPWRPIGRGAGGPVLGPAEDRAGRSPFLVDSVMAELVEQGLSIRAMLHPVIAPRAGPPAGSSPCCASPWTASGARRSSPG